ncbi:MAG: hypothetical protein HY040_14555 [Planctomycetes bacterium]|nr:hypothetical protein [Planctomycetota bacterium]
MANSVEDFARRMGATIRERLPDWGGGLFGAAQQGKFFAARMGELRQREQDRTDAAFLEIPLAPYVQEGLKLLADYFNSNEKSIAELLLAKSAAYLLEQCAKESKPAQADANSRKLQEVMEGILRNMPTGIARVG